MRATPLPIAIIGGGITGLTAAFRLMKQKAPVTLYEASDRVGGVIQTVERDGYLAEFGPNTLLETSPRIGELIRDLDLEKRMWYSDPKADKRFIVRGGKPVQVPASPLAFFTSRLFSTSAKLHLLREPFVRRGPADVEESVANFVLRRLGREFLDYAINPLIAGIYAGDPDRLSVTHAFPKLQALEQKYGSLIRGQIFGARERKKRAEVSKQSAKKLSFDKGLNVLTDTLRERLGDSIHLQSSILRIERTGSEWILTVRTATGEVQARHSAVIFCAPTHRLAQIQITTDKPVTLAALGQVRYPPVASVVLGFRRQDVRHPLNGFGVLVPEVEKFNILGTLFSSSLFPNRAPDGHVTLTSYVGGTRDPELATLTEDHLVELTIRDLKTILGVTGEPTFKHVVKFSKAIPQYEVGYGRFKAIMNDIELKAPGLFFAGHYRDGISLSDSIVSGFTAAERIEKFISEPTESAAPNLLREVAV